MMTNTPLRLALTTTLSVLLSAGPAFAGRGGGGGGGHAGGGGHVGGGGGAHYGGGGGAHYGGGGGAMAHPSFSAPRQNFSGGGNFNRPAQAFHPSAPAGGNFNRPAQSFQPAAPRVENFNRANVNNLNRANVNNVNRTNVGVNNFNNNRAFNNTVVNRPVNINNNYTRVNSFSGGGYGGGGYGGGGYGGGGYGGYGGRWPGRTPYWGYHQNWVNGAWNSNYYPGYGGYGSGYGYNNNLGLFGLGLAAGGLAGFGLGSSLANWGYSGYSNPYYYSSPMTTIVQQPLVAQQPPVVVYNYSQPIDTLAAPPQQSAADAALATFDAARQAFKAGDYAAALAQADAALVTMPNDPTLHEFRAMVFFAQGQYDAAAATLYPVLSAGPGWDWTTMVGLYPSVDVYSAQLRALETDSRANPDKVSDHFVLAYNYLTEGFPDNAAYELGQVTRLQPKDTLSARLLAQISKPATAPPGAGDIPPAAPVAAVASNAPQGSLVGTWAAKPTADNSITLSVSPDGGFAWTVADKNGPRKLTGGSTYGNDVLTLAPSTGDPLVGRVVWTDPNHFTFQAAGGGAGDPGLAFQKTDG